MECQEEMEVVDDYWRCVQSRSQWWVTIGSRMHVILNGEPLEEVDCYKYLGRKWQPMEDVRGMWYTE